MVGLSRKILLPGLLVMAASPPALAADMITIELHNFSEWKRSVEVIDVVCETSVLTERMEPEAVATASICTNGDGKGEVLVVLRAGCSKSTQKSYENIVDGDRISF